MMCCSRTEPRYASFMLQAGHTTQRRFVRSRPRPCRRRLIEPTGSASVIQAAAKLSGGHCTLGALSLAKPHVCMALQMPTSAPETKACAAAAACVPPIATVALGAQRGARSKLTSPSRFDGKSRSEFTRCQPTCALRQKAQPELYLRVTLSVEALERRK